MTRKHGPTIDRVLHHDGPLISADGRELSHSFLRLTAALASFAAVPGIDDLRLYSPNKATHQVRRVALKPSHAKRAKVKAARKQNRSKE